MKPKLYPILEMCIANGVLLGMARARKHTDTPSEDMVREKIIEATMQEIEQWFDMSPDADTNWGHH